MDMGFDRVVGELVGGRMRVVWVVRVVRTWWDLAMSSRLLA
jgi:hypothetical protein